MTKPFMLELTPTCPAGFAASSQMPWRHSPSRLESSSRSCLSGAFDSTLDRRDREAQLPRNLAWHQAIEIAVVERLVLAIVEGGESARDEPHLLLVLRMPTGQDFD